MKSDFNFTVQYYFPSRILWAVVAVLFVVGGLGTQYFWLAGFAIVIGVVGITTRYGVEIDFLSKQYKEYTWLLGYKAGDAVKFERIEYLFIKKIKMSQNMNSLLTSTTIDRDEYRGYIKFNEQEKIHFITHENLDHLIKHAKITAGEMRVPLFDYSSGNPEQLA